jgi:hypothetical protein
MVTKLTEPEEDTMLSLDNNEFRASPVCTLQSDFKYIWLTLSKLAWRGSRAESEEISQGEKGNQGNSKMAIKLGDKDNKLELPVASPMSLGYQHKEEDKELATKG